MYRDRVQQCPRCRAGLEQSGSVWRCGECTGCWIEERILSEMVLRMRDGLGSTALPFVARTAPEPVRACPSCGGAMAHVSLEGVELDRCAEHGIWFDARELETTLHRAGTNRPANDDWAPDFRPEGHVDPGFWSSFWDLFD